MRPHAGCWHNICDGERFARKGLSLAKSDRFNSRAVEKAPPAGGEHTTQTPEKQGVDDQSGAKSGALVNESDAAVALPLADQRNPLSALAAALLTLSDADRERLAAVMALLSRNGEE